MTLRDDLSVRLRVAMKQRDRPVATALRTALGELANAEAVPVDTSTSVTVTSEHVAGSVVGVGAAEAARRDVPATEQRTIIEQQRAELLDHAGRLAQLCRYEEADGARRAASVLDEVLGDAAQP